MLCTLYIFNFMTVYNNNYDGAFQSYAFYLQFETKMFAYSIGKIIFSWRIFQLKMKNKNLRCRFGSIKRVMYAKHPF